MYYVIINMCFQPLNPYLHYMFLLVAEKILVPVSVISVIRLSLFVLRYNYLSMCSLGRNLCSSGRNLDSWRWIMVGRGITSATYHMRAILNQCRNNWLKEICCVSLLNDCGPHRHLKTFFTKQKLFLLKF